MRVVDAGVLVGVLAGGIEPDTLGGEELVVPHLIDSEVTNVLRRLALRGDLTDEAATAAMDGFGRLSLTRFPRTGFGVACGRCTTTFPPTTLRTWL